MSTPIRDLPLPTLIEMVRPLLALDKEIISEITVIINVPETKPAKARALSGDVFIRHGFNFYGAEGMANLVRILAIIKEIHGQEVFDFLTKPKE